MAAEASRSRPLIASSLAFEESALLSPRMISQPNQPIPAATMAACAMGCAAKSDILRKTNSILLQWPIPAHANAKYAGAADLFRSRASRVFASSQFMIARIVTRGGRRLQAASWFITDHELITDSAGRAGT